MMLRRALPVCQRLSVITPRAAPSRTRRRSRGAPTLDPAGRAHHSFRDAFARDFSYVLLARRGEDVQFRAHARGQTETDTADGLARDSTSERLRDDLCQWNEPPERRAFGLRAAQRAVRVSGQGFGGTLRERFDAVQYSECELAPAYRAPTVVLSRRQVDTTLAVAVVVVLPFLRIELRRPFHPARS